MCPTHLVTPDTIPRGGGQFTELGQGDTIVFGGSISHTGWLDKPLGVWGGL